MNFHFFYFFRLKLMASIKEYVFQNSNSNNRAPDWLMHVCVCVFGVTERNLISV